MEKVFMRTFNDCQTAAYATILQVPYEEAPRLYNENDEILDNWRDITDTFLASKGYYRIVFEPYPDLLKSLAGKFIAGVESSSEEYREKGYEHAVIFENGKLWHDPGCEGRDITLTDIKSVELLIPIFNGGPSEHRA